MCMYVRALSCLTICDPVDFVILQSPSPVNCLWYHGLQHARLSHPSLPPGVCSNAWTIPKRDPRLTGLIRKDKLGRISENPDKFRDEFVSPGLAVSLTWQDIMVILTRCCTRNEEKCMLRKSGSTQMVYWPPATPDLPGGWASNPRSWLHTGTMRIGEAGLGWDILLVFQKKWKGVWWSM